MEYKELIAQENSSVSVNSPGIISDSENISRILFLPNHYKNDKVAPNAFEQVFQHTGMSVLRQNDDFSKSLDKTINIVTTNNSSKRYKGHVSASVLDIRTVMFSTFRIFYVLDTATEDRKAHADVYTTRKSLVGFPKEIINDLITSRIFRVFKTLYIEKDNN